MEQKFSKKPDPGCSVAYNQPSFMTSNPNKEYYPFLDGLRALAAFWVLLHHLFVQWELYDYFGKGLSGIYPLVTVGFFGVDVFFVISGFLITGLLLPELKETVNLKRFYVRRFLKIVPHYYAVVLLSVLFLGPTLLEEPSFISYGLFFQNYFGTIDILSHTWSLAVEEHFYLIYPLALLLICRLKNNFLSRIKTLIICLTGVIIFQNILRFIILGDTPILSVPELQRPTHLRLDGLALGCLVKALEVLLAEKGFTYAPWIGKMAFLVGGIFFASLFTDLPALGYCDHWYSFSLASLATALIIFAATLNFCPLAPLLNMPFLRWIGRHSYGIYLWHYIILWVFINRIQLPASLANISLYLLITLSLGILTSLTIERYCLRLRQHLAP